MCLVQIALQQLATRGEGSSNGFGTGCVYFL